MQPATRSAGGLTHHPEAGRRITFTAHVGPAVPAGTNTENCGTVASTSPQTSEAAKESCTSTTITPVATNVSIVKTGPATALTCAIGRLPGGATRTFSVTATAGQHLQPDTVIENCGTVYTSTAEADLADNGACVQTVVSPGPAFVSVTG